MYLVCTHHPERVHSFRLAIRGTGGFRYITNDRRLISSLEGWLEEHAHCGGGLDHFTIAFDLTKDHDVPKIQPVADRVHAALASAKQEVVDVSPEAYGNSKPRMDS